ncbi:MAG: glycosyltransferase family 39 protein [Betaproteobacteria bacterium]|nr:glycosyltransferase family 39 protein [Betaproteobacteria bacterium]
MWVGVSALLLFRLWFSAVLPMTGDEAYFVLWGEHPAGGYYDHPPMVGWWLAALLAVSRAEWVLRLPALVLPLILAGGAWWLVRPHGAGRARAAAWLVLLAPADVWNVLITTDTPVILLTMLSALAYVAAQRRPSLLWYAAAGALLGLAFLGKYFAALPGIAYLAHVLFARRDAGRWAGFAVLLLAALPAPIYNLWWNSGHCWTNILFNFVNRHDAAGLSWQNPLLYLASLAYLATPWLLLALWRHRGEVRQAVGGSIEANSAFWLAALPFGLFAALSLVKSVGLHWLVSFVPFLAVLAAIALPLAALGRLVKGSAGFAGLHMASILIVSMLPMQAWDKTRLYDSIVLTVRADELLAKLQPYAATYTFAMDSYSSAATLAYHAQRPFAVFGEGSFHARQDDFNTDWRAQDGGNVLILRKTEPQEADYAPYFRQIELRDFELRGARFYLVLGQGFGYDVYHERVLRKIRERFYRIPAWLPQRGCAFYERYFSEGR